MDDLAVVESNRNVSNRNFRTLIDTFRTFLRTFFVSFHLFRTFKGRKNLGLRCCFGVGVDVEFFRILDLNSDLNWRVNIFELLFIEHFRIFELFFRHFSLESLLSDLLDGHPLVEVVVDTAAAVVVVAVVVDAVAAQVGHNPLQISPSLCE